MLEITSNVALPDAVWEKKQSWQGNKFVIKVDDWLTSQKMVSTTLSAGIGWKVEYFLQEGERGIAGLEKTAGF